MTFKRIGDVAWQLIADPVKLQAAANEAPQGMGSGPFGGRATNEPPIAQAADEGQPASNSGMKRGGRNLATPAEFTGGNGVEQPGGKAVGSYGERMNPAVRLVASTGMPSVERRPKASGHAIPALGRPVLVLIEGGRYHASSLDF